MKFCKRCNENRDTDDYYCRKCGEALRIENSSASEPYSPKGCTMDYMGHIRPDMERKRDIRESFKDRW